jgi:hypothetical protein
MQLGLAFIFGLWLLKDLLIFDGNKINNERSRSDFII